MVLSMSKEEKVVRLKWTVTDLFAKFVIFYTKIQKTTRGLKKGCLHKITGFSKSTKSW